ncbi:monofunctional biosynthetic peptidoglycan transglycosylase, partial [Verminephrobacter sp. Larva24]
MPARVRAASWPGWTSRPMKALMRWLALLVLAL